MCGIAGRVDPGGGGDPALLRAMCDAMVHRGPDSAGYLVDGGVMLGMRRLAIIDVAGGDQPRFSEDGRVAVVFNGEIYNHRELRAGLLARGHVLSSDADTEVIAAPVGGARARLRDAPARDVRLRDLGRRAA